GAVSSFSDVRRMPLPAYRRNRATPAEEGDPAGDIVAARWDFLGRANSGAFCRALWLPQSRAMGRARSQAASTGVFSGRELDHLAGRRVPDSVPDVSRDFRAIAGHDAQRIAPREDS